MSGATGRIGPLHPWLGSLAFHTSRPVIDLITQRFAFHRMGSRFGRRAIDRVRDRLDRGASVHLLGIGPGGHNAGVSLVRASRDDGIELLGNHEEERFRGEKHYPWYPARAVDVLQRQMTSLGLSASDIDAVAASWDYHLLCYSSMRLLGDEFPWNHRLLRLAASPMMNRAHVIDAFRAPERLGAQLGLDGPMPVIGMRHHDNHAYFAYAVSPFVDCREAVMVAVLDGAGDDAAISTYVSTADGDLRRTYDNQSLCDSLGCMYGFLSSTQGGWPVLSSEGRYMGATAWGDGSRETNVFYRPLRDILHLADGGRVYVNRSLVNWHRGGNIQPYRKALSEILGPPIPPEAMWDPDHVLDVDEIEHRPLTQERADKAAAVQMVFEDGLAHVVEHLIRTTGSSRLVLTGGVALNCVANMHLLERFDSAWYARELGRPHTELHLWVPPVPSDPGVLCGAAYHLAFRAGARGSPSRKLEHAFYCGLAPTREEIEAALRTDSEVAHRRIGNVERDAASVAETLARIVSSGGIVGLYQGVAETGPRALGHRSILADPSRADALDRINARVKHREAVRPVAPMVTLSAARSLFDLPPGLRDDEYNALNYMVLTVRARPEAKEHLPAIVHRDGTSRIQIVRPHVDPLCYAYLQAMGRRIGFEASINTSLNVGSPICQTPVQAIETLRRSRGLDGLFLVADTGETWLAWHDVDAQREDRGRRLLRWLDATPVA